MLQLVLEHDKELESLVQEEHEHVEELVHEVEDMKKRDKMLEAELEKYKSEHGTFKSEYDTLTQKIQSNKYDTKEDKPCLDHVDALIKYLIETL